MRARKGRWRLDFNAMKYVRALVLGVILLLPLALFAQTDSVKDAAFKTYCQTAQDDTDKQAEICGSYWETPEYAAYYEKTFGFPFELGQYCYEEHEEDAAQKTKCYDFWKKYNPDRVFATEAYDTPSEQISDFSVSLVVNESGSLDVAETIVYDFGPNERHGIYRDIPVVYKTKSGGSVHLDLKNIQVKDEAGEPTYTFTTSRNGNSRRIKIGDPDVLVRGIHTYVISYTVPWAVGFFDSYDEIYWNVTGNDWEVPILHASALVTLPFQKSGSAYRPGDLRIACYAGAAGSSEPCEKFGANELDGGKNFDGAYYEQSELGAHEGLTVAVGFPKGVVVPPTAGEKLKRSLSPLYLVILLPVVVFVWRYRKWSKEGRDPKGTGIITAQYDAPDSLSPMESKFVLSSSFGNSLAAEIVFLATKGYVRIERVITQGLVLSKEDYELTLLKPADANLARHQALLLEGLFSVDSQSFRSLAESVKKIAEVESLKNAAGKFSPIIDVAAAALAKASAKEQARTAGAIAGKVKLSDLKNVFYVKASEVEQDAEEGLILKGYFPPSKAVRLVSTRNRSVSRSQSAIAGGIFAAIFVSMWTVPFVGSAFGAVAGVTVLVSWLLTVAIWVFFAAIMPKMTEKGVRVRELVKGFKLYLSVAEGERIKFHNAPAKNPETFEKFLPYAMAFGVEKKWAEVFKGITLPPPAWYGDSSISNMTGFNSAAFASSMSSFSSVSSSNLSSAPGSSSGSSGGGSSGGGGGGGGGGSW